MARRAAPRLSNVRIVVKYMRVAPEPVAASIKGVEGPAVRNNKSVASMLHIIAHIGEGKDYN